MLFPNLRAKTNRPFKTGSLLKDVLELNSRGQEFVLFTVIWTVHLNNVPITKGDIFFQY